MAKYLRSTAVAVLLCSLTVPVWAQQFYLYEPKPVPSDTAVKPGNTVLVKEVPVQSGNTLYGISRKFTGHGMYYPQILLFNNIKDPNLIHAGDTLKIPLPKGDVPDTEAKHSNPKILKKTAKGGVKGSARHSAAVSEKVRSKEIAAETEAPKVDKPSVESRRATRKKTSLRESGGNIVPVVEQTAMPAAGDVLSRQDKAVTVGNAAATGKKTSSVSAAGQQIYEKAVKAYKQEDYRSALDLFDRYLADNPDSVLSADASLYKAECYLKLSAQ